MYKYIAIHRSVKSDESEILFNSMLKLLIENPKKWNAVIKDDDLVVFETKSDSNGMCSHRIDSNNGVVLGHLFGGKPSGEAVEEIRRAPLTIKSSDSLRITEDGGWCLQEKYWGSYVSIIKSGDGLHVSRSPFGAIPCFHYHGDGVSILFSHPEILYLLKKNKIISMNWGVAVNYLVTAKLFSNKTAFNNVTNIPIGEGVCIKGSKVSDFKIWNPITFCSFYEYKDIMTLMKELRNIIFSCFGAWSSIFSSPMLRLSGGFDSSLVAGVMSKLSNRPNLSCITFYDRSAMGDERGYARITARKTGFQLYEIEMDPSSNELQYYRDPPKLPWPYMVGNKWNTMKTESDIGRQIKSSAVITGNGGDLLFGLIKRNMAALDYLHNVGFNREFWKVAYRSARVSNTSLWDTLKTCLKYTLNKEIDIPYVAFVDEDAKWGINQDVIKYLNKNIDVPYWHLKVNRVPPGQRNSFDAIMNVTDYIDPLQDGTFLGHFSPIISQPIVEICLRIPYYIHQFDGRERGLARRVFSDCLADEIRLRQFKSHGAPYFYSMVAKHRDFLVDYILEGVLAENNLLDTAAIHAFRKDVSSVNPAHYSRIADLAASESWARVWR